MTTMTIRCDERDKAAAAAVAEYYGLDLGRQLLQREPRAITRQLGFVIVKTGVISKIHEMQHILAREHWQALARVENERHSIGS